MTTQPPDAGAPVCYRHPGRATYISCQRCARPICPECMTPASVGFQCPECVAEGRKSVRPVRTAFGGRVSGGSPAVVTFTLVGLNVAVWLAVLATGAAGSRLVDALGLRAEGGCLRGNLIFITQAHSVCTGAHASWLPSVSDGAYWQLLTSMFLHVTLGHIASNMILLVLLGMQLEPLLGRSRFLALYLVSGLAGSAVAYGLQDPTVIAYGASGAVFGLLGAMLLVGRRLRLDLRVIGFVVVINVVGSFTSANVSWQAHLGGFVGGLAMTYLLIHAPSGPKKAQVQWLGTGGLVALIALAVVVRSLVLG